MIPPKQTCRKCRVEKINFEFRIVTRTQLAKLCLECEANNPDVSRETPKPKVARETSVKRRREPKGTGKPYVQAEGSSILVSTKKQLDDLKRIREATKNWKPR